MAEAPLTQAEITGATRIGLKVEASKVADSGWSNAEKANVNAAKERADKNDGRGSLETLASGFNYAATWEKTAEQQVQTGFNAATGDREPRAGSTEAADLFDVNRKQKVYSEFLDKGYDGLSGTPAQKAAKQEALRVQVEEFIKLTPAIYDAIPKFLGSTLTDTFELRKIVERTLRDPGFRDSLAKRLNGLYDPKNLPSATEESLISAQTKLESAESETTKLTGQLGQDMTERGAQSVRMDEFKTTSTYDSTSISTMLSVTKEDVHRALSTDSEIAEYQKFQRELVVVLGNRSSTPAERTAARGRVDAARTNKVSEFEDLSREKNDIETRLKDAQNVVSATESQLITKRGERTSAKTELDSILTQRKARQVEFVGGVKNAVRDTAQEHLVTQIREAIRKYPEYKSELQQELKNEADEKIKAEFDKRWTSVKEQGRFWYKDKEKIHFFDKVKTGVDVTKIAETVNRDGNPDAFVEDFLRDAGLSPEQIVILKQDKGFIEAQRSLIVSKAVAAHVGAGGKISEGMQSMLTVTPWGKRVSEEWIKASPEAAAKVKELTGKDVNENSLQEIQKKKHGKQAALLILLMAIGAAMVGKGFAK